MAQEYVTKADIGPVIFKVTFTPPRTPSDDIIEKLKARRAEIVRKLGPEARALREEFNEINAALAAYRTEKVRSDLAKKRRVRKAAKR